MKNVYLNSSLVDDQNLDYGFDLQELYHLFLGNVDNACKFLEKIPKIVCDSELCKVNSIRDSFIAILTKDILDINPLDSNSCLKVSTLQKELQNFNSYIESSTLDSLDVSIVKYFSSDLEIENYFKLVDSTREYYKTNFKHQDIDLMLDQFKVSYSCKLLKDKFRKIIDFTFKD